MSNPVRKTRICYVLNTLDLGGAETVALDLARSHDPDRYEVEIVGAMDPVRSDEPVMARRCRENGVKVVSLGQANLRSPLAVLRFYHYLRRGRFDIVMGHNRGSDYWAVRLGRLAGIQHRYWARHLVYPDVGEKHRQRYRKAARHVHRVIAVSEAVRAFCLEEEGLTDVRVETVVNGIDTERFHPLDPGTRAGVRRELGHPEGHAMVLFVGRFSDQKAPEAFPALISRVNELGVPAVGYMCGHGPAEGTLQGLAEASGGRVRVLGLRSDIPRLLGACDLFVSTSRYEGLPLNVMEAMATGAAFAGPAIPQIRELVGADPDLADVLFEAPPLQGEVPAEMVAAWAQDVAGLLREPDRSAARGARGRGIISEKFSLRRMVDDYERIYREDLDATGKAG